MKRLIRSRGILKQGGGSVRLKLITLEKYQVLYRNYFGLR